MASTSEIRQLQQQLIDAGFALPRFGADSKMGAETRDAIRVAEAQFGLTVDGEIDDALIASLTMAIDAARIERMTGLAPARLDERGEHVRLLQQALKESGFNPGVADGIYGNRTREAMIAFQRQHGLAETGNLDEETLVALRSPAAPVVAAVPEPTAAEAADTVEAGMSAPDAAAAPAITVEEWIKNSEAIVGAALSAGVDALPDALPPFSVASAFPARIGRGVLREGAENEDVQVFKQGLVALNYLSQEDYDRWPSRFDDVTRQALRDFQEDYDISVDGVLGNQSWDAMTETLALPPLERLIASSPVEYKGRVGVEPQAPMFDTPLSKADTQLLTRLVFDEAGNQSVFGQQAVVENVLNRVLSPKFPDTVKSVIYQKDSKGRVQYEPTLDGLSSYASIPRSFRERMDGLIGDVVSGERPQIIAGSLYFANMDVVYDRGSRKAIKFFEGLDATIQIGDHTFFEGDSVAARTNLALVMGMEAPVIVAAGDPIRLPMPRPDIEAATAIADAAKEIPQAVGSWIGDYGHEVQTVTLNDQQAKGPAYVPDSRPWAVTDHNI